MKKRGIHTAHVVNRTTQELYASIDLAKEVWKNNTSLREKWLKKYHHELGRRLYNDLGGDEQNA